MTAVMSMVTNGQMSIKVLVADRWNAHHIPTTVYQIGTGAMPTTTWYNYRMYTHAVLSDTGTFKLPTDKRGSGRGEGGGGGGSGRGGGSR